MAELPTRIVLSDSAVTICDRCRIADRMLPRMKGLLGRKSLPEGEGILLQPAPSIHTWFMRFPIDAVFLDHDLTVVSVVEGLRPWRIASRRGARAVLELAAGEVRRRHVAPGQRLSLVAPGSIRTPVIFVPTPSVAED